MRVFNKTSLRFFVWFVVIVIGSISVAFVALFLDPNTGQYAAVDSPQEQGVLSEN